MLLVQKKMKPKETDIGQIQKLHSLRDYLEVKEANVWILIVTNNIEGVQAYFILLPFKDIAFFTMATLCGLSLPGPFSNSFC